MPKFLNKKRAVVAGVAVVALGGGMAYAYWTTSGSGSGTGATTAGQTDNLVFTQTALTPMYPGDSEQTLTVNVKNNATESAYVTSVKAYITTDKGVDCDGSNFLLNGTAAPSTAGTARALTWTAQDLAASASDNATGTIQFNNTASNQDLCKSAVVTIHYLGS